MNLSQQQLFQAGRVLLTALGAAMLSFFARWMETDDLKPLVISFGTPLISTLLIYWGLGSTRVQGAVTTYMEKRSTSRE